MLGVDPGGTTGIAVWEPGFSCPVYDELDPPTTMDFLRSQAVHQDNVIFVVEKYIITPATAKLSQQHDALELIGVVKYLCRIYDHRYTMQSPSEAKSFATDAKLKKAGWYKPGLPHARDASRHVLTYAAKNGLFPLHTLIGG